VLDQRLGHLGTCGVRKAGPSSSLTPAIGDEGELAHDERFAARVEERAVEASCLIREDPQARDLGRKTHGRVRRVFVPGTDEREQAGAARAHDLAVDADGGP